MQNFTKSAAGEQQEPKGRCREWAEFGEAFFFPRKMLCHGFFFIHVPRNACCLSLTDGRAEPFKFGDGQKTLPAIFFKLVDPPGGIGALRNGSDASGER